MSRVNPTLIKMRAPLWLGLAALSVLSLGCVEQADEELTKEDLEFVKRNLLVAPPTPQFVTNADLDGKVTYLGLDIAPNPVEPGREVHVTHYFKVNAIPGEGWKMFTHVNSTNKKNFINVDHGPVSGKYPVSQWKVGNTIRDQHSFRIPADWATENIEIYWGLWRGRDRMPIKAGRQDEGRVLAAVVPMKAKTPPPLKRYLASKTAKPIKIDGKLDEPAWKTAPSTGAFVDTLSGNPSPLETTAKILWDKDNLYFAFENVDTDAWSQLTERDAKLWTQEAIEIMLDADGNGKTYIELQVAPNGTLFDTFLPTYRKYEDSLDPKRKPFDWNSKMKAAVMVDGTVNKRDDVDKSWTVEMALPMADINGMEKPGAKTPPSMGDVWRVNLFRMDTPKDKGQIATAWSPPLVGDFHKLDRFGELVFADEKGNVAPPKAAIVDPKAEKDDAKATKDKKPAKEKKDKVDPAKGGKEKAEKPAKEKKE